MKEEKVSFNSGDISLEGILTSPETQTPVPAVVVCHPHPQYGGNMHNNVVAGITHTLLKDGFITLRFNLRGVGASEGSYGDGIEEARDVKGAVDFIDGINRVKRNCIFLVGYSFGAMVGLPVAFSDDRVKGWIGISPPVAMHDFSYLKGCFKPKLIIFGDSDFVCPKEDIERLFESLQEPKSMRVIPGTDHFLIGKEETISKQVTEFIRKVGE
jgi:alpha/beta superfamily hydrolase